MKQILLAAAALGLSGCAVTEATAPVPYTPGSASLNPAYATVKVTVSAQDARVTNRGRIGTKINGYGMEMAAIRTDDDIAADVKNAIYTELKDRGYDLEGGGAQVSADVKTFYAQFHTGMFAGRANGDVDLLVKVTGPSGAVLYTREIHGVSQLTIQLADAPNAARAISAALSNAMMTMFDDPAFGAALAGRPAPGTPSG